MFEKEEPPGLTGIGWAVFIKDDKMTRQEFALWVAHRIKPHLRPYLEAYDPNTYDDLKEIYAKSIAMSQVRDEDADIIAPGNYKIPRLSKGKQTRLPSDGCCG